MYWEARARVVSWTLDVTKLLCCYAGHYQAAMLLSLTLLGYYSGHYQAAMLDITRLLCWTLLGYYSGHYYAAILDITRQLCWTLLGLTAECNTQGGAWPCCWVTLVWLISLGNWDEITLIYKLARGKKVSGPGLHYKQHTGHLNRNLHWIGKTRTQIYIEV